VFTVARGVLRANARSSSSGREIERHTHSPLAGRLIPAGLYGRRTSRETSSASRTRSFAAVFTPEPERIASSASLDLRAMPRPRHAKPGRTSLSVGGAKTLGRRGEERNTCGRVTDGVMDLNDDAPLAFIETFDDVDPPRWTPHIEWVQDVLDHVHQFGDVAAGNSSALHVIFEVEEFRVIPRRRRQAPRSGDDALHQSGNEGRAGDDACQQLVEHRHRFVSWTIHEANRNELTLSGPTTEESKSVSRVKVVGRIADFRHTRLHHHYHD